MIWLVLIGVGMFVLGGLLAVQPSKHQKRLAALRGSAMQKGVHIKLPVSLKFPDNAKKSDYPYYCLMLTERDQGNKYRHVLRRDDDSLPRVSDPLEKFFCGTLNALGTDYKAVYVGSGLVGVSWNESGAEQCPERLLESLEQLKLKIES
jgi:hypothetical protein